MKKILSLLAVILFTAIGAFSQAPGIFNYQGVARNSVGNVLINQSIALRITIHDGTTGGPVVYQETRGVVTNPFGLFNVQVGSPGATNVTGTITGVPWGVGNKYIQVEIDPAGGSSFINIGTAQIASVPYALFSTTAADLVLPFNKTQANAGTLFTITNSGTGISGAIMGVTQSPAANAWGVHGRVDNTAAGAFSAGVLGTNLSTTGNGIGVMGTQNGSGWGVYGTTPSGIGVIGATTSGIGGRFTSTSGQALFTTGGVRFQGINEAANRILATVPGDGTATWQSPSVLGIVTGSGTVNFVSKWTPTGTNLGNSIIFDNGTQVGINTATPTYRLHVVNGGSDGILSRSTSGFSVSDIDANNGDAALRFLSNGTFRWNIRNDPAGNDLQFFDMGAGQARMRLLTANGNLGIATGAPIYRLDVDVTNAGSSNGIRIRHNSGFATVDIVGVSLDQALRFGKNGTVYSGINTLPDGDHINFFKFGAGQNLMSLNVNTGNLGVGGPGINGVAKVHVRGFNVANNLYSSSTGFLGAAGIGSNDVTAQATNEKWGIHTYVDGGVSTQHAIFAEPGTTGAINTGLFARVSTAPVSGQSFGLFAFDPVNTASTWAATIRGRLQYQNGTQGLNKILVSDAQGNATWQTLAGGGAVSGSGTLNFIPKWTPDGFTLGNSLLFDNGAAIGLGTITPSHRFTVSHGGATGIVSRSTVSFSVIDIDAQNGDAALRFASNGTNQWNNRNQPGTNNLEWFEFGGGGTRMILQDATGNLGVGQSNPTYRLDVQHGGATGIHSQSAPGSGSFSVVDIDADNGDAALRLQRAGTGQWNIRNRPADDYLEIFELGGGGSRVVVQDGTGNVGIGNTTSPSYRLDVQHGGATGIRSQSTASFSVIDIDGQNGDAALRFARAGVNQWNIRNRPADDYLEIFELGGGGSRMVIQDGTGNVGIGNTTSPSYRLDVQHGGATGIRSQSTASFSLMDIDAANGDAALRFIRAGVNQWNTRNNPATDDYQIFELGGGGERLQIQNGTGNIGIGGISPNYRLDVQHGGATGLHVVSTSTFSVMDVDGANGDAAVRFGRAGVNQWNIRNNPATDDLQFFELGGGGERMRIDNTTGKVWVNGDFTVLGIKAFTMDHPLDPANKTLMHAAAESNEVIDFYSGNVTTDASGKAVVKLPDYYEALNKDSRYQLTVIGAFAQAIISKEVSNNQFEIATSQPNVKVSWEVKGVRNDAHMQKNPFVAVQEKPAAQKGKYLDPAAYNQPASKGVSYDNNPTSSIQDVAPAQKKAVDPASITGGSLDLTAPKTVANKADNNGSVADVEPAKAVTKTLDVSGSVIQTQATKPSTKKEDVSGSISDEMQKPVIKTQELKSDKVEPAKQNKEVLPAILKGSSMDPDAKPVMPAVKTQEVTVPAQNSGNTRPAAEDKQVSKENNSVPSSTVPAKKD